MGRIFYIIICKNKTVFEILSQYNAIYKKNKKVLKKVLTKRFCFDIIIIVVTTGYYEPLAQLAEHLTFNQRVWSSNLQWLTTEGLDIFQVLFLYALYASLVKWI